MIPWHQYLFGILFLAAGINHFRKPKLYEKIIPSYIPSHSTMVIISGITEMVLGFMLLNKNTQQEAAWGIIILMILFLPIHFYIIQTQKTFLKLPKWALVLGIPLQFALIAWATLYI